MASLDDRTLLAEFAAGTLPESSLKHVEHVRLAWLYSKDAAPASALKEFCRDLRRYAEARGKTGLYHETITWAYLLLIRERMARQAAASWPEFAARNADLLAWRPSVLDRYYRAETLGSDLARRVFLMPDRLR